MNLSSKFCKWSQILIIITAASLLVARPKFALALSPITSGPTFAKVMALTFDDGPHPFHTPQLLDLLDSFQIKATFFVVGIKAAENPFILKNIVKRGHVLGNHSWSHPNLSQLEEKEIEEQMRFCNQAIEAITGTSPRFFRPPGGNWDNRILDIANKLGLQIVLWTINGYDAGSDSYSPQALAKIVIRRATPGAIVLLHDGGNFTLATLPLIINTLRKEGYSFVTLEQMLHKSIKPISLAHSN